MNRTDVDKISARFFSYYFYKTRNGNCFIFFMIHLNRSSSALSVSSAVYELTGLIFL